MINDFLNIKCDESLLLVIDIQEKLTAVMGDLHFFYAQSAKNLQCAELLNIPTILTEQYPKGLGPTVSEITDHLPKKTTLFEKTSFSCWGSEKFLNAVTKQNKKNLIIMGMETHVCILQTALEGIQKGYNVFLTEDAVTSRFEHDKKSALKMLRKAGVHVTTFECLFMNLVKNSTHPAFKQISSILKQS